MFSNVPQTELATHDVVDPHELIPLTTLELDLEPPSVGGWDAYLASRNIPVVHDDLGRKAILRDAARQLITERRDAEQRQRELAERHDVDVEQQRLAALRGGVTGDFGDSPVAAMTAAAAAAERKRRTVLQEALGNRGDLTYHPISEER